jgi:hypothetical protein
MIPVLHLSWAQGRTGRQFFEIHRSPACADSCAEKIWNWQPLAVHSHGKQWKRAV